jgi:predicted nucleic acid-binding protein
MERVVISDTACLIALDKIGHLSLLRSLYGSVLITPTIADEFHGILPDWIQVREPANTPLQIFLEETIDAGEASAIALAVEIKDCYLILDDLRARKVASGLGLTFTGTLGIIAIAKKRGIIPSARYLFEKLRETDFWISDKFFQQLLTELGE